MPSQGKELRKCETCGKFCKGQKALYYHTRTHLTKEKNFQCDKCPKKFLSKHAVQGHIRKVHEGKYVLQHCSMCEETFKSNHSLHKHLYIAHGIGDLKLCPHCGVKCFTNTSLRMHLLHHKDPTLQCSHCEKMFKTKQRLESHERLHTGEKPYVCSICNTGFPSYSGLGQHMRGMHKVAKAGGKLGWHRKGKTQNSDWNKITQEQI